MHKQDVVTNEYDTGLRNLYQNVVKGTANSTNFSRLSPLTHSRDSFVFVH